MSMTAEQFNKEFNDLMRRVIQPGDIPIHNVIIELDKAHHNCLHILATIEAQQIAKGIVPAGSIPPNFRQPKPSGQN